MAVIGEITLEQRVPRADKPKGHDPAKSLQQKPRLCRGFGRPWLEAARYSRSSLESPDNVSFADRVSARGLENLARITVVRHIELRYIERE